MVAEPLTVPTAREPVTEAGRTTRDPLMDSEPLPVADRKLIATPLATPEIETDPEPVAG